MARTAAARIAAALAERGLVLNRAKGRELHLTAAGRRSAAWPETSPRTWVPFLGCRVTAAGAVALSRKKIRVLLRDIDARARRTAAALSGHDRDAIGRAICAAVNRALAPGPRAFQQRSAALLRRAVTDRRQLEQLDYWIARIIAAAVTGRRDARAFRQVAYHRMRQEWGLSSLVHARNRSARR